MSLCLKMYVAVLAALLAVQLVLSSVAQGRFDDSPRNSRTQDPNSPFSPRWSPSRPRAAPRGLNPTRPKVRSERAAPKVADESDIRAPPRVEGPNRMVQLAFMHRHGARTEPVVIGSTLSWAECHLSQQGTLMAVNLGQNLRRWYNDFIATVYNRSDFFSTSTDVERTIRTGYGVISGLFPRSESDNNFSIPLLHHLPTMQDQRLGYYYSWAAALLHQPELKAYNEKSAAVTLSYMTPAELLEVGTLTNATAICKNLSLATTCALWGEDVGTCRNSNRGIPKEYKDMLTGSKLFRAQELSNYFLYGLNTTKQYVRGIGPYGMKIVSSILDQFDDALNQLATNGDSSGKASPSVQHYSAHDITLYGLFVALGIITESTKDINVLVPMFTSVARFELYSNGSVTFVFSHCQQAFGIPHTYTDDNTVLLNCKRKSGETYQSRNCPVDDLRRFVATLNISKVTDPACYADPIDVEETNCAPWDVTSRSSADDPTLSPRNRELAGYCLTYRSACPAQACDTSLVTVPTGVPSEFENARFALDHDTLQCRRTYALQAKASVPASWLVCLFFGLGCFTTFSLLAVAIAHCAAKPVEADPREGTDADALITDEDPQTAKADLYRE